MCGRFTLTIEVSRLQADLGLFEMPKDDVWKQRYNIAPSQPIAVVTDAEKRAATWMRWGLIPGWSKGTGSSADAFINARGETASVKPAFRYAFAHRRCLVLADGYYEWQKPEGKKGPSQPFLFKKVDGKPFFFAGLWDLWKPAGTEEGYAGCAIITTAANEVVQPIHDRMPVMLEPELGWRWLSGLPVEELNGLLKPYPVEKMTAIPISRAVNDVKNDDASLILPLKA